MRALVLAVACAGCGAGSSLEGGFVATHEAGCDLDASIAMEAAADSAMTSDVVYLDHGTNGADPDASLPRCMSNEDCDGWATCQSGLCCSGTLVGDKCFCGMGPGCDLRSACCVPFTSTTKTPECVTDCETTCGCGQGK